MRLSDWSSDVCSSDIDGMAMDAEADIRAPAMADFRLYCRRVAGAVGVLSVHAFGATEPEAHELALAEGDALPFTNILPAPAEASAPSSEERRVGNKCVSTCTSRVAPTP